VIASKAVPERGEPAGRIRSPELPGTGSHYRPLGQVRATSRRREPLRNRFRSHVVPGFPPIGGTGYQDQPGTHRAGGRSKPAV
jgi:hypothetical protein